MTTYTKTFPTSTDQTLYKVTIASDTDETCTLAARDNEVQQIIKILEG